LGRKGIKITTQFSDEYVADQKKINLLYDSVIDFLPMNQTLQLPNMQKFLKRIMLSEINILTKL